MLKLAITTNKNFLVPCRKCDARKLVDAYGDNYGTVYDTDVDGYKFRGFPLSSLLMLADDFSRIVIER